MYAAEQVSMGTWFSDKRAEGTVGHRFYAGCQNVDTVETIAAEHAASVGAPYAYAQPHSGIDANLVAFWSILAHRVETPALERLGAKNVNEEAERGRLGVAAPRVRQPAAARHVARCGPWPGQASPNISGKMFHQQQYGTDPETGLLDYDVVRAKAKEFRPRWSLAGGRSTAGG